MRFHHAATLFAVACCIAPAPLFSGCNSYTGNVRTELVSEERVEEKISRDNLDIETLNLPTPDKPFVKIKVSWVFRKEYKIQKTFKVLREYYPYDAATEILEVVSSPFMFLLSLPVGLLMAPTELLVTSGENPGELISWHLMKMPFEFIHPGFNSDDWALKKNVYGKQASFEDTGTPKIEDSPLIEEKTDKIGKGAKITVVLPDLNRSLALKADDSGTALFRITEGMAALSQEGKPLTIRLNIAFADRTATKDVVIEPAALTEIYEKLMLG